MYTGEEEILLKFKTLRIAFITLLTAIFAVSAFHVIKIITDYKTADVSIAEQQQQFVQEIEPIVEPTAEPTAEPTVEEETITMPISIDFDALKQENSDIIGWVYCPDTPINYPVVKGKDNDQYLRADLNGKYLVTGTIFVDYRNGEIGEDLNYIVYGHNMKNSAMFGSLVNYKEQSYYDEHPILYFLTPENDYVIELCAGAVVEHDCDIYQPAPKEDTISAIISKSTFHSAAEITKDESIITLSTCSYEFNQARYILIGKLNPI